MSRKPSTVRYMDIVGLTGRGFKRVVTIWARWLKMSAIWAKVYVPFGRKAGLGYVKIFISFCGIRRSCSFRFRFKREKRILLSFLPYDSRYVYTQTLYWYWYNMIWCDKFTDLSVIALFIKYLLVVDEIKIIIHNI